MFNADFVTNLNALLMTVKESYDDLWEQNGENDLFNNKLLHLIQRLEPGYQPDASILSAIETTLFEEKDNKYETTDDTAFDDAEIAERVLTSIEILNLLCSNTETEKYYREYLDSGYPDRISPDTVQTAMNIKINRFRASQEIEQENNFESIAEHIVEELGKRQKNFFYWKKEWDKSIGERRNAGELHINYPRAKRAWHDYRTNVLCLLKQLRTSVSFFYLDEYEAFIQQIHAGYCKTVLELCHLNEELDENDYSNSILGTLNDAATIEDSPAWKIYNAYAAFELLEPWMFLETKPEDNEEEIICQLFYEAKINAITAKLKQDLKVYLDERKNNWLYKPQDLKNSGEHNSLEQRKNSVNALTKIEKLWEKNIKQEYC